MNKLPLIIKREFYSKVRNKSFIILTILSPLLIVGLFLLIVFLNQKNQEAIRNIGFVDESGLLGEAFVDDNTTKFVDLTSFGLEQAKVKTTSSYYGLIYIPNIDDLDLLAAGVAYYSEESPSVSLLGDIENKLEQTIRD